MAETAFETPVDAGLDNSQIDNATDVTETGDHGSEGFDSGDGGQEHVESGQGGDASTRTGGQSQEANAPLTEKAYRDAARAVQQQLPEHARAIKEMADNSFRIKSYQQHFPKPEDAAAAKQLIETIGGIDGAKQLQERDHRYQQQDDSLKVGNPDVLEAFQKDFPEGFVSLFPHYMDRVAQANPQAFQDAVAPFAVGMLENVGFADIIANLHNETDPKRVKDGLAGLYKWFSQQSQGVKQMTQARTAKNPAMEQVNKERQTLTQEKEQMFRDGVNERIGTQVTSSLDKVADQYAKSHKLNDTQRQRFRNAVFNEVSNAMKEDGTYNKQLDLRYAAKARTHDTVATYTVGEFNTRLKDAAFKIAKELWPGRVPSQSSGQVKPTTPKTTTSGGPIMVSTQPEDDQINWQRPDAEMNFITKKAYLKNGRFVQWK